MSQKTRMRALDLVRSASQIAAAYISHNHVTAAALPSLVATVHACLARLVLREPSQPREVRKVKVSAAQIRQSITPDGLISFIDGKSYKTLKRHLNAYGLTPARYRERYGLPSDYPMVAASYAKRRSAIAKNMGLGLRRMRRQRGGPMGSQPVPRLR